MTDARPQERWPNGYIRLFISHSDNHREAASRLCTALSQYGVASFVAHADIAPASNWRAALLDALQSMEAMLAFVADDFEDSAWVNQEVGYAAAREIPIIPLKLGTRAPVGFIETAQGLPGSLEHIEASAEPICRLLTGRLDRTGRLREALIAAFLNAGSYIDAMETFKRLDPIVEQLSPEETAKIIHGFEVNENLNGAGYLTNTPDRFLRFLQAKTGERYRYQAGRVAPVGR